VLARFSPARRRLVLAVLVFVVAAVAALTTVFVLSRTPHSVASPAPQETPGPVLLVPGYGGGPGSLRALADRLTAAGRDATVVAMPDNGRGDFHDSAAVLDEAVTAALDRTGARTVDVVGYSAGGLVARVWAADGGADRARRVLTLGSPHHGTRLADLAGDVAPDQCPTACQQMTGESDLLARLNARDETPAGPTWVSIWTTQDQTVTPPDSARLEGAVNLTVQSVCPDAQVSHGQLPNTSLVQQMVLAELAAGAPVELGPADCARLSG
jgi:triacylglycerol esterase/lipase EstA (alpha/beta hydrolase family)